MTRTRSRAIARAFVLLLAPLLAGCSDLLTDTYDYGHVQVVVTDRSGAPAPGLNLVFYNSHRHTGYGQTDGAGRVEFDFVPEGNYGVYLTMNHQYVAPSLEDWDYRDSIVLGAGAAEVVEFTVYTRGAGTVQVAALDETGAPVADVGVTLIARAAAGEVGPPTADEEPEPGNRHTLTGVDGIALFDDVGWGAYRVEAAAPEGYAVLSVGGEFIIDAGWVEEVEVRLESRPQANEPGEDEGGSEEDDDDAGADDGTEPGNDGDPAE